MCRLLPRVPGPSLVGLSQSRAVLTGLMASFPVVMGLALVEPLSLSTLLLCEDRVLSAPSADRGYPLFSCDQTVRMARPRDPSSQVHGPDPSRVTLD